MIPRTLLVCTVLSMTLGLTANCSKSPDPLPAQRATESRAKVDAIYANLSSQLHGIERQENVLGGSLRAAQNDSTQLELKGGSQYFFGGACDRHCDNLDLFLVDIDGTVLAADQEEDDKPIVNFIPSSDGTVFLQARMLSCSEPSCHFQVDSFFQGNPWISQCDQQLDRIAARLNQEFPALQRVDEPLRGSLAPGAQTSTNIDLSNDHDYLFIGVCDEDCFDLNLVVKDRNGQILDSDLTADKQPVVSVEGSNSSQVEVIVDMVTCQASECFFGLDVLKI